MQIGWNGEERIGSGTCPHLRYLEHSALNPRLDQMTASHQFVVKFLEQLSVQKSVW
jgi:hypothetical protein